MMTTIESMKTDDELSQTVELVECGKAENTPKIESFVINTPNSVNPGTSGNLQNSQTTFQFQQSQPVQFEDEPVPRSQENVTIYTTPISAACEC